MSPHSELSPGLAHRIWSSRFNLNSLPVILARAPASLSGPGRGRTSTSRSRCVATTSSSRPWLGLGGVLEEPEADSERGAALGARTAVTIRTLQNSKQETALSESGFAPVCLTPGCTREGGATRSATVGFGSHSGDAASSHVCSLTRRSQRVTHRSVNEAASGRVAADGGTQRWACRRRKPSGPLRLDQHTRCLIATPRSGLNSDCRSEPRSRHCRESVERLRLIRMRFE
eukprot:3227305-Rhodomonas_salina.3